MMNGMPYRLSKADYLQAAPIFTNRVSVKELWPQGGTMAQLHLHEFVEVSMVVAGHGVHRMLGEAAPCSAGDVYIVKMGVPHGYFAAEDGGPTVSNLLFDADAVLTGPIADAADAGYCHGIFGAGGMSAHVKLSARLQERAERLWQNITQELLQKEEGWLEAAKAHLTLLLLLLRRAGAREGGVQSVPSKTRMLVMDTMQAVMQHYGDRSLTLATIADGLYVSKSYLSRVFFRMTGQQFSDYLRGVRLSSACRLLRTTQLTNEQIVAACGLRDVPTFYKVFKAHTGQTPHSYRKGVPPAGGAQGLQLNAENGKGDKAMDNALLNEICENLQRGKAKLVGQLVQQAIDEGVAPETILNDGLLRGMNIVGEKFKANEVYVPEVLVAARAMNAGTQALKPLLAAAGVQATGKVCIGTVQGDLHDIGKNLVKMMLEGKGLEVVDLGTDVAPETFVQTAIEQNCQVICCSALLTTTMGVMEDVVKKAVEAGIRDKVKIMIGGAPVNEAFCEKIGADMYTTDAASAADAAVAFCRG